MSYFHNHIKHVLPVLVTLALGVAALVLPTARAIAGPAPAAAPPSAGDEWAGKTAPDFSLSTLDGRRVKLGDFRGKVVLLNFWATWCAPCRVEMPWLVDFYRRYRAAGLEIVGVSVDDGGRERVATFVQDRHVIYTILLKDDSVGDAYGGLRFLPQTFFIGRDGKILERTYGVRGKDEFEADIRRALREPAPDG